MIATNSSVSLVNFYINGIRERPGNRTVATIVNPATGVTIGEVPYADAADAIPDHHPLRLGTFNSILRAVARHKGVQREKIIADL